ncbi:MAG: LON peptidase substrate-binding domain-containing protein [Bryobacter sp.]|jgi:Lon protease-like protein|nr:LON peptidase substrate-binding domain-containing protein [Bryobacter sp.]
MPDALLPLFPLGVVLLPRTPLPLHIFEDRYKEMIGEAIAHESEFGVIFANEKGLVQSGCTAVVERVLERYPDGRLDIVCQGQRRFEVITLNEEKSYLQAAVEYFDDDAERRTAGEIEELRTRALDAYRELVKLGESGDAGVDYSQSVQPYIPNLDEPRMSFQIGNVLTDVALRQQLLAMRSEAERLRLLAETLPRQTNRLRRLGQVKRVAPRNGHSKYAQIVDEPAESA